MLSYTGSAAGVMVENESNLPENQEVLAGSCT